MVLREDGQQRLPRRHDAAHVRMGRRVVGETDIRIALGDRRQHAVRGPEGDLERDPGIGGDEVGQAVIEQVDQEACAAGEPDRSLLDAAQPFEVVLEEGGLVGLALGVLGDDAPGLRRHDAARQPLQEILAALGLHLADVAADRGGRDVERFRGASDGAGPDDGQEVSQRSIVHRRASVRFGPPHIKACAGIDRPEPRLLPNDLRLSGAAGRLGRGPPPVPHVGAAASAPWRYRRSNRSPRPVSTS